MYAKTTDIQQDDNKKTKTAKVAGKVFKVGIGIGTAVGMAALSIAAAKIVMEANEG